MANADLSLVESDLSVTVVKFLDVGRQVAALSKSLSLCDEDKAKLDKIATSLTTIDNMAIASIAAGDNNIGNVDIASIAAGDNNIGNVDVLTLPTFPAGDNNIGNVDVVSSALPSGAATASLQADIITAIAGNVAHGAADAGNASKIGYKAKSVLSTATLVATDQRTDAYAGLDGIAPTRPHALLGDLIANDANNTDGTATTVLSASGDAAIKTYLTYAMIQNTSASGVVVAIESGTTEIFNVYVHADSTVVVNPTVPIPPNAANEVWGFDPATPTSTIYANFIGFKSKV